MMMNTKRKEQFKASQKKVRAEKKQQGYKAISFSVSSELYKKLQQFKLDDNYAEFIERLIDTNLKHSRNDKKITDDIYDNQDVNSEKGNSNILEELQKKINLTIQELPDEPQMSPENPLELAEIVDSAFSLIDKIADISNKACDIKEDYIEKSSDETKPTEWEVEDDFFYKLERLKQSNPNILHYEENELWREYRIFFGVP
jgi:predicted CopG family antitoxin